MRLLLPLGLLGLVGIIVLIIIYILKPNYQQKLLSSTYVWKMSLKYRKKKLPVSKLRNLLILICQILIIALLATILARPIIPGEELSGNEKIVIIDSSASMLTTSQGAEELSKTTRYERAVKQVIAQTEEVLSAENGCMTVILAGETSQVLAQRAVAENKEQVLADLAALIKNGPDGCEYGNADIDGAMVLAEDILYENPNAEVVLYTGTNYIRKNGVNVMDMSTDREWNVAILGCEPEQIDGYWAFNVEVASYHGPEVGPEKVLVNVELTNVNGENKSFVMAKEVVCDNEAKKVEFYFKSEVAGDGIPTAYSYDVARVYVEYEDSNLIDNVFYSYGGNKELVRIQYASAKANPFVTATLLAMRDRMSWRWNIFVDDVQPNEVPVYEGFDLYIFEHRVPAQLPNDGVVILMNVSSVPTGLDGLRMGALSETGGTFTGVSEHPILKEVAVDQIVAIQYYPVVSYDDFDPVLFCDGYPMLLIRNNPAQKVAVLPFSVHTTTVAMTEFTAIFYNLFNYFLPSTATQNVFEVNQQTDLNCRGAMLTVKGPYSFSQEFVEFPAKVKFTAPGTYTIEQVLVSGSTIVENVYVHIGKDHSNVVLEVDELTSPVVVEAEEVIDQDLIIWFAIALVALLFIEWILHTRDFRRR